MIIRKIKMNTAHRSFLVWALLPAVLIAVLGSYRPAVIVSGSMEPALSRNDLVIIKLTDEAVPGDIAVYKSGDELIAHRVTAVSGDRIITKGDANNTADPPIDRDALVGVAVGRPIPLPIDFEKGIYAKYLLEASGESIGRVARWDVSALEEVPDTMEIISGNDSYEGPWYEFTVNSDSETSAEYELTVTLNDEVQECIAADVTAALFIRRSGEWILESESCSGELTYADELPVGYSRTVYRLGIKAADAETAGQYSADINVKINQKD